MKNSLTRTFRFESLHIKEEIQKRADRKNKSVNEYINELLMAHIVLFETKSMEDRHNEALKTITLLFEVIQGEQENTSKTLAAILRTVNEK